MVRPVLAGLHGWTNRPSKSRIRSDGGADLEEWLGLGQETGGLTKLEKAGMQHGPILAM